MRIFRIFVTELQNLIAVLGVVKWGMIFSCLYILLFRQKCLQLAAFGIAAGQVVDALQRL
jgi:hypothetical protein